MQDELFLKLASAFECHQQGDLSSAKSGYLEILAIRPDHLDANQLLGAVMVQLNEPAGGIPFIEKAIAIRDDVPQYHVNLGAALSRCGRREDAAEAYSRALELDPSHLEALKNFGLLLGKLKRFHESCTYLEKYLTIGGKTSEEVLVQLGVARLHSDDLAGAEQAFRFAEKVNPDSERALAGVAQVLLKSKKPRSEGVEYWKRLIELSPENVKYLNNLATLLKNLEQFQEAIEVCESALKLEPGYLPARSNLGLALAGNGDLLEARKYLREVAAQWIEDLERSEEPRIVGTKDSEEREWLLEYSSSIFSQLASLESMLGDDETALLTINNGIELNPGDAECRLMRGFIHLAIGDYKRGFEDYEYRKQTKHAPRKFDQPEWCGKEDVRQKHVLVHAEQGLGDALQFLRYVPELKSRCGQLSLMVRRPLIPFLEQSGLAVDVHAADAELPAFERHVPLMSLPFIFENSVTSIPNRVPYFQVLPQLVEKWKQRLEGNLGHDILKIGICWQGNPDFAQDEYRSTCLSNFAPLAKVDGVKMVSLQKGEAESALNEVDFEVASFEDLDANGAFLDSASIIKNLDLVVTTDTSIAHLAGALGARTWLATSYASEWRWMRKRTDCPWYPTMTLYRQKRLNDWGEVFAGMAIDLAQLRDS